MASILITGANRGIGRALTARYAARGDRVLAASRGAAVVPLDGVEAVRLDVKDPRSCSDLSAILEPWTVDILICNASVLAGRGGIDDPAYTEDAWLQQMMTNVAGVFFTVRASLPALRRGAGKRIAIISSVMASSTRAPGGTYAYRASKAAALNLGRNLAADLAGQEIAVGIYHPGWVRTDMGGGGADIDAAESAEGLVARIDALSLATTGVFEDYRGQPLPY